MYRFAPPIQSCYFLRLGRQLTRCPRRLILSTCSCLLNGIAALGFPTRYRAARFSGTKSNFCGSLILEATCFAVSARSNLSWARYDRLMQAGLCRAASSLFRIGLLPSNTNLSCNISHCVLTVLVLALHPDSLMMSGACPKSGAISKNCPA